MDNNVVPNKSQKQHKYQKEKKLDVVEKEQSEKEAKLLKYMVAECMIRPMSYYDNRQNSFN